MIGLDIGGTKCAVSVGWETEDGLHIESRREIPTDHNVTPYDILKQLCDMAREMTDDFSAVGISCGGPLNSRTGYILSPPNLPGWDEVPAVDIVRELLGSEAVFLQNDANACALAEWRYGAGRGTENMVFLTFGSGMGAGLILNGKLYDGTTGMAGEVGHMRMSEWGPVGYGKSGSFEGFCSGNGLAALGRMLAQEELQCGRSVSYCKTMADLPAVTAKSIAIAADAGNEDARRVYALCAEKLGAGLAVLMDILNPECIVIGSVFARSENLLREAMEKVIEREALYHTRTACRVVPAALGNSIGDYAALSCAAYAKKECVK